MTVTIWIDYLYNPKVNQSFDEHRKIYLRLAHRVIPHRIFDRIVMKIRRKQIREAFHMLEPVACHDVGNLGTLSDPPQRYNISFKRHNIWIGKWISQNRPQFSAKLLHQKVDYLEPFYSKPLTSTWFLLKRRCTGRLRAVGGCSNLQLSSH